MSILSHPRFHDEAAAFAWVEAELWPEGPTCPHCGALDRISAIKPNAAKKVRIGLKFCGHCRKQFTVRVGTIFEDSHLPMTKWLQAIHLMVSSKKGVSSHQLMRTLETTYKTAWFLMHRIRAAMDDGMLGPLGGEGITIEADETLIGGKERNKRLSKRNPKNIGAVGKQIAFTLVERNGRARSFHVANVTGATLGPIIFKHADRKSRLMTDDAGQYRPIGRAFVSHDTVNHGVEEYVRGEAHSNTVEGYFSILKRGIVGVYQHVSEAHLHRYLAEFDFRYSNRVALGVDDQERAARALAGVAGKRLTYRRTGERV
jgi:transposase-like protein